ncbi:MAG: hypothetical protein WCO45_18875 [Pseudanabaena sp. ELA607]
MQGIEKSASRLKIFKVQILSGIAFLSVTILGGGAAIFSFNAADKIGITSIKCQRVSSSGRVDCQVSNGHWAGLANQKHNLNDVKQASLNEGINDTYSLVLQLPNQSLKVSTGFGSSGSFQAKQFHEQINIFLQSAKQGKQKELSLATDIINNIEPIVAVVLGILMLLAMITGGWILGQLLVFYKTWRFDLETNLVTFSKYKLKDLFTQKVKAQVYQLNQISAVEIINYQDLGDEESTPTYAAVLVISASDRQRQNLKITDTSAELAPKQALAHEVANFLGVPFNSTIANVKEHPDDLIFTGQKIAGQEAHYKLWGDLADLPKEPSFAPIFEADQQLQALDFVPLQIMTSSGFPNIQIAGYANESHNCYGTILFQLTTEVTQNLKIKFNVTDVYFDFYTLMKNGKSLTTTSGANVNDMPEKKIFWNSAPSATIPELYDLHQQRLKELSIAEDTGFVPVTANLLGLAMAIDEFVQRRFS